MLIFMQVRRFSPLLVLDVSILHHTRLKRWCRYQAITAALDDDESGVLAHGDN